MSRGPADYFPTPPGPLGPRHQHSPPEALGSLPTVGLPIEHPRAAGAGIRHKVELQRVRLGGPPVCPCSITGGASGEAHLATSHGHASSGAVTPASNFVRAFVQGQHNGLAPPATSVVVHAARSSGGTLSCAALGDTDRAAVGGGAEVEAVDTGPQAIAEMMAAQIVRRRTMLFTTFRGHFAGPLAEKIVRSRSPQHSSNTPEN